MFLTEPNPTPYDLRWRMFGIDVRVHPFFWVMAAMLGYSPELSELLIWILAVFVSVLIHELGHVVAGRLCGIHGNIVLYCFGGLAVPASSFHKRWQHVGMCFAGPLAGFILAGLAVLGNFILPPSGSPYVRLFLGFLEEIGIFWGILNLLPIWPLDGGQISRDLFDWLVPDGGVRIALGISLVISGVLAACAIAKLLHQPIPSWLSFGDSGFSALLFGSLAFGSFAALQAEEQRRRFSDDRYTPPDDRYYEHDDRDY